MHQQNVKFAFKYGLLDGGHDAQFGVTVPAHDAHLRTRRRGLVLVAERYRFGDDQREYSCDDKPHRQHE